MARITERQQKILDILLSKPSSSSSEVHGYFGDSVSLVTIKRDLSSLNKAGYLEASGSARARVYGVSWYGRFRRPVDAKEYFLKESDGRPGLLPAFQARWTEHISLSLFDPAELSAMRAATTQFVSKSSGAPEAITKRELERFVIELSWKSSRIEGNTYTLLDTEHLLKEGVPSSKNTKEETQMILNHKTAFDFTREQKHSFEKGVSKALVEEVHKLLLTDLDIPFGIRKFPVGITGSGYRPLDNEFQIVEALEDLVAQINAVEDVYTKALLALLGISYIQPFVDGNKRTARLLANAILMAGEAAPLSYRSVDEVHYRECLLVFYEQLSVVPMKELFIDQYLFAAENYTKII